MAYKPMEDLLPKSGYSTYKLVRMATQRAMELADNKPRLIEAPLNRKIATVALDEIIAGKVVLDEVADQFDPETLAKAVKAAAIKEQEDEG